jgi:phage terminase large subunit-like protein
MDKISRETLLYGLKPPKLMATSLDHNQGILPSISSLNFKSPALAKSRAPFEHHPYQQFTIYNIFAWINAETKLRRINFVYEAVARKNGKTTIGWTWFILPGFRW